MNDKTLVQLQKILGIGLTVAGVCGNVALPSQATVVPVQSALSTGSTTTPEQATQPSFFMPQVAQLGKQQASRRVDYTFTKPKRLKDRGAPAPGKRIGGGSRGGCPRANQFLTALVPVIPNTPNDSVLGLTFTNRPTFWFYLPYSFSSTRPVVFALKDDRENIIYQTELSGSGTRPSVVGFKLPDNMQPLEVNKRYKWHLTIYCDREELSDFRSVEGWVERVALDRSFQQELAAATPQQKLGLYAREGIWYEAVTTLAEQRRQKPNDDSLKQEWDKLMQGVDLGAIAPEPITSMLTPKK
jgi:hypothetical protein